MYVCMYNSLCDLVYNGVCMCAYVCMSKQLPRGSNFLTLHEGIIFTYAEDTLLPDLSMYVCMYVCITWPLFCLCAYRGSRRKMYVSTLSSGPR